MKIVNIGMDSDRLGRLSVPQVRAALETSGFSTQSYKVEVGSWEGNSEPVFVGYCTVEGNYPLLCDMLGQECIASYDPETDQGQLIWSAWQTPKYNFNKAYFVE